jgi:hypothetical protein
VPWLPARLLLRLLLAGYPVPATTPCPCCSSSCRRLLQQRRLATCCNCILLLLRSQLPSVVMVLQVPAVLVLQLLLVLPLLLC